MSEPIVPSTTSDGTMGSASSGARPSRRDRIWTALTSLRKSPVTVAAALVILTTLVAAIGADWIGPFEPNVAAPKDRLLGVGVEGHLLGTDAIGRDVFTRLLFGSRLAWIVGSSVSVVSLLVGATIGAIGGFFGGWFDTVSSRFIDGMLSFPPVLLALVLAAVYSPSTGTAIVALAIVYAPLAARVMRSVVLSERQLDYVSASRGLGHRETWSLIRHVLPNAIGPMFVVATIIVSRAIIVESSLSFIGAGSQAPNASWGLMIAEAQDLLRTEQQLIIIPAAVLVITVLSINLLADSLSDYLDPGGRVGTRRSRRVV
jgi:ABC-type dipeptide/oligopeptide/nickel transport system permease subunit